MYPGFGLFTQNSRCTRLMQCTHIAWLCIIFVDNLDGKSNRHAPAEDLLWFILGVESLCRILVGQQIVLLVFGHSVRTAYGCDDGPSGPAVILLGPR